MQGIIIGAGIGGLVAAVALRQRNLLTKVYEAKDGKSHQGAGIVLSINAMRVLDKLGLADQVIDCGNAIHTVRITDEKLQPLSSSTMASNEKTHGHTNRAIHRADLQDILLKALPDETIEWGKKCIRVNEKEQKCMLHFEDKTEAYGDYVIAADGIHSAVRQQLFPNASLRDVKQICWRGVVAYDLPDKYHHQAVEAWGRGRRFGFSKMNEDYTYWFAVINKHGNNFNFRDDLRDELKKQFGDFDPMFSQMIDDTPESRIIRNDLWDLKPIRKWHSGRSCLLGDAAHAITPNLGQGAGLAIEDAWVLAGLLNASKNPGYAFPKYQKTRKPDVDYVAKWSYRTGEIAHYENFFLTGLRNTFIKRMPQSLLRKKTDKLFRPGYEI